MKRKESTIEINKRWGREGGEDEKKERRTRKERKLSLSSIYLSIYLSSVLFYFHLFSGLLSPPFLLRHVRTSNSVPLPVLMVVGEKAFQMMLSQILVAMKREIPDPSP